MAEFKSFKNKIVDFGTKAASFKGDDGKTVDYTQVVLTVQLEGSNEEIVLSGVNAPKPKLLQTILRCRSSQSNSKARHGRW